MSAVAGLMGPQGDEAGLGALDQQMIKNNAARQAWGFTAQAGLNAIGAENEAANERAQSYSTLLTGAQKKAMTPWGALPAGTRYNGDTGPTMGNV